jgi:membrane protein DedA with SNARE-associated domain
MAFVKFLVFTVIGCAVWCTALVSLGYSLGSTYNHVLKGFSDAGYAFAALFVLAVAALFLHRLQVVRTERRQGKDA